jgi:hypothetical protein
MSEELDDLFNFNPEQLKEFEQASVDNERKNPPDGEYTVKVLKAFAQKKPGGDPQLNLHLKITSGEQKGRILFKNYTMTKNPGMSIMKKDLWKCGIQIKGLDEIRDRLPDLLDLNLLVVKKSKPDSKYYQLYINALLPNEQEDEQFNESMDDTDRM